MSTYASERRGTAGLPPGCLSAYENASTEAATLRLTRYSETELVEQRLASIRDLPESDGQILWLDIIGNRHVPTLEAVGERFNLHPLVLEDIASQAQRPKLEEFDTYQLLVLKMLDFDTDTDRVRSEQVALIITDHTVITFQEREGDVFGGIRERLRAGHGRIRRMGSDYLFYALMDAIVDQYFVVLGELADRLEGLDDTILENPTPDTLRGLHATKREVILMRKNVWPLREAVGQLSRNETSVISEPVRPFLRDLYDHTVQLIDTIETMRDVGSGLLDLYMSGVSNRMNEVMKMLTLIATIFIPITFVAGIYGMNFEHMPELHWRYGYATVWAVMACTVVCKLAYFRKRHWL